MSNERHWHASDAFCQPRDRANAIHLAVGAWEYRTESKPRVIARLLKQGWEVAVDYGTYKLLKYTHWERIE